MKRRKWILALLTLCLLLGSAAPAAYAAEADVKSTAGSGVCYNYTVQRVEDTLRYLDEIYIEKYPALGLRFLYGDSEDKATFQDLADVITEGCNTDREKADAIAQWIYRNVEYSAEAFSFPTNAVYNRIGNCLGYAVLMQTLLRLEGIPAVWGDGWRGDMEFVTPEVLFNMEGHAWCWAYLDGEWVLYDPLWLAEGTTDREYMAKWMYFESVETVRPVYDVNNCPPTRNPRFVCYDGSRFMAYRDGQVDTEDNTPITILNYSLWFYVSRRWFEAGGYTDGISYEDKTKSKDDMLNGELFRDGWIRDGSLHYAYENGIQASGTILMDSGKRYYADLQSSGVFRVLASEEEYSLHDGYFCVKPGYQGKPLETTAYNSFYGAADGTEHYTVKWESDDPKVASVTEDGIVTAVAPGLAFISAHFYRDSDGTYMGSSSVYGLLVTDEELILDLSDCVSDHAHVYTQIVREPSCRNGYTIHTCTHAGCADSYIDSYVAAVGHTEVTVPGKPATCTESGLTDGTVCPGCGQVQSAREEIPALGHKYEDGVCIRCGKDEYALDGVLRIAGADRIDTSLMLADQLKGTLGVEKFDSVIVASALNFPDALTGSYLAAVKSAPILLTYEAAHGQVQAYIEANLQSGGTVYILGGESAVSAGFQADLTSRGMNVKRLAGSDRFGTNLKILEEAGVTSDQEILICTATGFADSLSASAAGLPILLVHGSLTQEQKDFLAATSGKFVIIGGTGAVSAELENELRTLGTVTRLGGASRYETSVMVAQRFVSDPDAVILAYARNYPDGLCGGPLAAALNAALILTDNYDPSAADAYVENMTAGIVVGGKGLISDESARVIFDLAANAPIQVK